MNKTWITSDLHFYHANIIKYCPDSRGHFESVEQMNQAIIDNINAAVAPDDTLYLLGDIGFASADKLVKCISQIACRNKILIHGNHDVKFIKTTEFLCNLDAMGIIEHVPYKRMVYKAQGQEKSVLMCLFHFPIESWDSCGHGSMHLHGHCHSGSNQVIDRRRMDVGMDSNNMQPYDMDLVVQKLLTVPANPYASAAA